jgi:hypothetical protein
VSLEQSLKNEQNFFLTSPAYRAVADVNGTRYLAQKCNRLLTGHIRKVVFECSGECCGVYELLSLTAAALGLAKAQSEHQRANQRFGSRAGPHWRRGERRQILQMRCLALIDCHHMIRSCSHCWKVVGQQTGEKNSQWLY